MYDRIINIIWQYASEDAEIEKETNLLTDLGLTSFELATMTADFEEEFGISIETDEMMEIRTVADIADCIQKHL